MNGDSGKPFWGQKTFCVLTGASQGIGRQFAVEFAGRLAPESVLLLLARSEPGLQETRRLVAAANPTVHCALRSVDLGKSDAATLQKMIHEALDEFGAAPVDFKRALLVHNAGSLGQVGKMVADMDDVQDWNEYMVLNVNSVCALTSVFLKIFSREAGPSRTVVNITSLCAVKPFLSMGQYCVGKAAREMYFKVLAEEDSSIDVLSYSPGPVDTDMTVLIINNTADDKMRKAFVDMKEKNTIVTCEQTAKKAAEVLENKKYKTGERVDFFDEGY